MGTVDMAAFRAHLLRRSWFVVAQALVITIAVVAVLSVRNPSTNARTVHFVLHPASTLSESQVPAAMDGLRPDGSLLQTVLQVLGSKQLLQLAVSAAHTGSVDNYVISSTVETGSAFFDVTVTGPDPGVVTQLAKQIETVGPGDIDSLYHGYALSVNGLDTSDHKQFPPSPEVLVLALMLGAALGIAFTFVEWWFHKGRRLSQAAPVARAVAPSRPEPEPELESTPDALRPYQFQSRFEPKPRPEREPVGTSGNGFSEPKHSWASRGDERPHHR